MNELLNSILNQDVELPLVVFLMLFSLGLAVFHTVIVSGLFEIKIKSWFFFVFNPLVIGLTAILYKQAVFLVFLLLVISIFVLAIIGMIYAGIKDSFSESKKNDRFYKKYNIKPKSKTRKFISVLLSLVLFVVLGLSGFYMFLIIFGIIILQAFLPNNKNRFLKYQGILPTSKIHTVAMGLAEVKGKLKYKEPPILAPIKDIECIGFTYKIESISTDKDGKTSYTTIFEETKCNRFYIEDETGQIEVKPEELEMIWIDDDSQYSSDGKRFSQYLLKPNDEMILVGKVSLENNTPIFEYESIKKVFAIAPVKRVDEHNDSKPFMDSIYRFTAAFVMIVALILITPIKIEKNTLFIGKPQFQNPIKGVKSFEDLMEKIHKSPENNQPH